MEELRFKIKAENNLSDDSAEEFEETEMKSLQNILKDPKLLGKTSNIEGVVKSSSGEKKRVLLTHQNMLFNDKECQILTIRDTSASHNLKKANEQN